MTARPNRGRLEVVDLASLLAHAVPADPDTQTSCLIWQRATTAAGYGHLVWRGRYVNAHRLAFALAYDVDLDDLIGVYVSHLCGVKACIHPAHLEASTPWENIADEIVAGRAWWQTATHCRNGHPIDRTDIDPRPYAAAQGLRRCLSCHTAYLARQTARRHRMRPECGTNADGLPAAPDGATATPGPTA